MEAYLSAMEERVEKGKPVDRIRSVASFFVSRVDTNVDKKLDAIMKDEKRSDADKKLAQSLRSKFAIANARVAYEEFEKVFGSERFAKLAAKGVRPQRPLWASTSTKDPALPDLYYVEALVAPQSVNTVPPETFTAYRDHGDPKVRIHDDLDAAHAAYESLKKLGIDDSQVYRELEEEGVKKFFDSYGKLLQAVAEKEAAVRVS
jgi:transaldolase